jgi:hypothetical protein
MYLLGRHLSPGYGVHYSPREATAQASDMNTRNKANIIGRFAPSSKNRCWSPRKERKKKKVHTMHERRT